MDNIDSISDSQVLSNDLKVVKSGAPNIQAITQNYLASIRGIGETSGIVLPHLAKWLSQEFKKTKKKIDGYEINFGSEDGLHIEFQSASKFVEFTRTMKKAKDLMNNKSFSIISRSLFIQMFCEFDSFIGDLLKCIYLSKTDLLNKISKEISLSELLKYENLNSVIASLLEKEIENFRRDSYIEQFSKLESKFGIKTLKDFPEWNRFVELTQRRNIIVHNNAIVNDQYMIICKSEGVDIKSDIKVGSSLDVELDYFVESLRLMSKVGYMLAHTLWFKLFPDEYELIHESMNKIIYDVLEDKRWKIACEFSSFSITSPMIVKITDLTFKIRIINYAISLKFSGNENKAIQIIDSYDWSASYRDFKLALAVLRDDYQSAVKIMEEIGKSGEIIDQSSYHTWPLFHKFREHPEFYSAYERIYSTSYKEEIFDGVDHSEVSVLGKNRSEKKSKPKKLKVSG